MRINHRANSYNREPTLKVGIGPQRRKIWSNETKSCLLSFYLRIVWILNGENQMIPSMIRPPFIYRNPTWTRWQTAWNGTGKWNARLWMLSCSTAWVNGIQRSMRIWTFAAGISICWSYPILGPINWVSNYVCWMTMFTLWSVMGTRWQSASRPRRESRWNADKRRRGRTKLIRIWTRNWRSKVKEMVNLLRLWSKSRRRKNEAKKKRTRTETTKGRRSKPVDGRLLRTIQGVPSIQH